MNPLNKTEAYFDYLTNDGATFAELPEAMTRTEQCLYALCVKKNGEAVFAPAEAVADSVATDAAGIVTDFNGLLAKLRTAGIIASE